MTISRRKFIKTIAFSSTSFATSSGIFFPKPAEAYSINYLLSDGTANNVFKNIIQNAIASGISEKPPSDLNRAVLSIVQSTQADFTRRQFNQAQTPFAKRLNNQNNPLWGRQKQEDAGPNPGFATIQTVENQVSAVTFSGSTTIGIDRAIKILAADAKLSPSELDGSLIPVREQFEDWGTWAGDVDPRTGKYLGASITTYATRLGEVTRRYDVIEPGKRGSGNIQFTIESGGQPTRIINIRIQFA